MTRYAAAVVGAGVAGLAAAYQLRRAGESDVVVIDAQTRPGGVIQTENRDGFLFEGGPDSFLAEKPAAEELCRELGLGEELIGSNDAQRRTWILYRGQLQPLPQGWRFLAPSRLAPALATPLLSWRAKLGLLREAAFGGSAPAGDETVAAFVRRRLGREVLERIVDPLLAGVYGGDAENLGLSALPRVTVVRFHAGLQGRRPRRAPRPGADTAGVFRTLRGGLQTLIDALAGAIGVERFEQGGVTEVTAREGYDLRLADGRRLCAGRLVVALPAWAAAAVLGVLDPELARELAAIPYASSLVVNLAYGRDLPLPAGFGLLAPRGEGKRLIACTFVHRKFPGRAPVGASLLRLFYGGSRDPAILAATDEEVLALARRELAEILAVRAAPDGARIHRWPLSMAQYAPGHEARIERIRRRIALHPGLALAGNAYAGVGLPDCIAAGRAAARAVLSAVPQ